MVGVDDSALVRAFQGADLNPSKLATMIMAQGFSPADLSRFAQNGVPDTAIAVIATYYGFEAGRNCTAKARSTVLAFSSIGFEFIFSEWLELTSLRFVKAYSRVGGRIPQNQPRC